MSIKSFLLAGWEELSTWGYDEGLGGFYAQLTRNGGDDSNGPEIWISPSVGRGRPAIGTELDLARLVADAVGVELDDVIWAMHEPTKQLGHLGCIVPAVGPARLERFEAKHNFRADLGAESIDTTMMTPRVLCLVDGHGYAKRLPVNARVTDEYRMARQGIGKPVSDTPLLGTVILVGVGAHGEDADLPKMLVTALLPGGELGWLSA